MYNETMEYITDSQLSISDAVALNPLNPAPTDVLASLVVCPVSYYSFDDNLHQGQIVMHEAVKDDVLEFFKEAVRLHFPIAHVIPVSDTRYAWSDELSCEDNNTSGFNYRVTPDGKKLSLHGRGLAFDVNPVQNPYIKYENGTEILRIPHTGTYKEAAAGTLTAQHQLVLFMKSRGWTWGGDWTIESGRIDYHHFEKEV